MLNSLLAALRRSSCLLCEQSCADSRSICIGCELDLPWLLTHCSRCALPLSTHDLLCGQCAGTPPPFQNVQAAWRYAFPIDALINRFKHHAEWPLGHLLADLLSRHLSDAFSHGLPRPDALVPVPLGKQRQRQRGFNQALLLSRWLGQQLNLSVREDLLWRQRETTDQQSLNAKQRKRNLRHAFALQPNAHCQGLHLALVDDVMTTGSTAATLSQLLLDAGAASISLYCLARTPKPN